MTTKPAQGVETVVLPSGVFVSARPRKWIDMLVAEAMRKSFEAQWKEKCPEAEVSPDIYTVALCCCICTFDQERWPLEKVLDLDGRDVLSLMKAIEPLITGPVIPQAPPK